MYRFGWIGLVLFVILMLAVGYKIVDRPEEINAESAVKTGSKYEPERKYSTGYVNPNNNPTFSGKPTVEGITIAGREEDIGKVAAVYLVGDDGGLGEFVGYYIFQDTGYGKASQKYPGKGTIQTGECVDIYYDDYDTAIQWGEKQVWVQIIDGVG